MQALQLTERQHERGEVDTPLAGPGEVLVRVVADDLPFTQGHENAGVVEALGAGVPRYRLDGALDAYGPQARRQPRGARGDRARRLTPR